LKHRIPGEALGNPPGFRLLRAVLLVLSDLGWGGGHPLEQGMDLPLIDLKAVPEPGALNRLS
jgi:hypothetical protein